MSSLDIARSCLALFRAGNDTLAIAKMLRINKPDGSPNEARVVDLLDEARNLNQQLPFEEAS